MKHTDIIQKLNLEQKCALLSGETVFTTRALPGKGIPAITLSDGPNGVRKMCIRDRCTDGTARTVNVDNKLNFPAGKLVEISVDGDGESVQSISPRSTSGTCLLYTSRCV